MTEKCLVQSTEAEKPYHRLTDHKTEHLLSRPRDRHTGTDTNSVGGHLHLWGGREVEDPLCTLLREVLEVKIVFYAYSLTLHYPASITINLGLKCFYQGQLIKPPPVVLAFLTGQAPR